MTRDVRNVGVDLTRGLAVVSMYVAHTAPGTGPADVLILSEFLTFTLFGLLVGVGAELGRRRTTVWRHLGSSVVKAVVLVALGLALKELDTNVVIVLGPLGVLTLVCWALSRAPAWLVAVVGLVAAAIAPWTLQVAAGPAVDARIAGDRTRLEALDLLASTYYPQAVLVAAAAVGILLVRWLVPARGRGPGWLLPLAATGALLVGCGAVALARTRDLVVLEPYVVTHVSTAFQVGLSAATLLGSVLLVRLVGERPVLPLAWVGAMTLTLYCLQVVYLAWWRHDFRPGVPDDQWVNVVGLTLASVLLAVAWRALPLRGAWRKGPLEGVVGMLTRPFAGRRSRSD